VTARLVEKSSAADAVRIAKARHLRLVRGLAAPPGSQVEEKYLGRFVSGRAKGAEVDEGYFAAVRADREAVLGEHMNGEVLKAR